MNSEDEALQGYLEALVWTCLVCTEDAEDSEEPLDALISAEDIPAAIVALARAEVTDFLSGLGDLSDHPECGDPDRVGHDFYLTREGHGAGFWDGDYPECGEQLTRLARAHGGCDADAYRVPGEGIYLSYGSVTELVYEE